MLEGNTPDYIAPEVVVARHLLKDCKTIEELDEWEGYMYNVVAADAWAAGAVIYFAATGSSLVDDGVSTPTGTLEEYQMARLDHLRQVHAQWKVSQTSLP